MATFVQLWQSVVTVLWLHGRTWCGRPRPAGARRRGAFGRVMSAGATGAGTPPGFCRSGLAAVHWLISFQTCVCSGPSDDRVGLRFSLEPRLKKQSAAAFRVFLAFQRLEVASYFSVIYSRALGSCSVSSLSSPNTVKLSWAWARFLLCAIESFQYPVKGSRRAPLNDVKKKVACENVDHATGDLQCSLSPQKRFFVKFIWANTFSAWLPRIGSHLLWCLAKNRQRR